jgi:hypothetical protein
MFRPVLIVLLFWIATPSSVDAQQSADPALARTACDCPDIDIVLFFDRHIAELEAKLVDVNAGRIEDVSGFPNNPVALRSLIAAAQGTRAVYLRDIAACQRMCRLYPDLDSSQPLSAYTGASAACPECAEAEQRLSQAEIILSNLLTEIERFRELNRIRERDGVDSADFQSRRDAADRARVAYEVELRRHQTLVDRAEALKTAATNDAAEAEWAGEDGRLNLPEFFGFMGGRFIEVAAAGADFFLEAARQEGLPISDQTSVSDLGDAYAAERLAERYHREHVAPLKQAWDLARLYLPDENRYLAASYGVSTWTWQRGSVVDQLAVYEQRLQPLITERDAALAALIDCNLNHCRPTPDVSDMFGPDGPYAGQASPARTPPLPDDGLGLAPEAPILPSNATPAPADPEPVEPDAADGLGLGEIEVAAPGVPPEVQAMLAQLAASGVPAAAGPCEFDPEAICRKIDPQNGPQCLTSVTQVRDQCVDYQQRAFIQLGRQESCRLSCDYSQQSINVEFWLRDRTIEWLDTNYSQASTASSGQLAARQARLAAVETEISELESTRDRRSVHVYRHAAAGTLIQHSGPYFDPRPPLEYIGEAGGAFSQAELARWNTLQREREQLTALIDIPDATPIDDWYADARQSWEGGGRWPQPMACEAPDVPSEYQACIAQCTRDGDSAGPQSICQPSSIIGRLNAPGSTHQIYPPGDPRREP